MFVSKYLATLLRLALLFSFSSKYLTTDIILVKFIISSVTSFLIQTALLFFEEKVSFKNKDLLSEISLVNSSRDKLAFVASKIGLLVILK